MVQIDTTSDLESFRQFLINSTCHFFLLLVQTGYSLHENSTYIENNCSKNYATGYQTIMMVIHMCYEMYSNKFYELTDDNNYFVAIDFI